MEGPPSAAAEPRAAATLVIARDGQQGLEVLLTRRSSSLRFMGGAMVFPGGALAAEDLDDATLDARGLDGPAVAERMGEADGRVAVALHICALREAAEEVGLAGIAATDLVYGGRWVTPLGAPVRFDTRFFLVRAPATWAPTPDPSEVDEVRWTTPAGALTELASGKVTMAPPTVTYIVGTGPTFVVDPAVDDAAYLDAVLTVAGSVGAVLVTHRHPDHVGGVRAVVDRTGAPVRAFGTADAGGVEVAPLTDGEVLRVPGARLTTIHAPGHASDHVCFLLAGVGAPGAQPAASLFAGDNVLGEGTAVIAPPDGDMADYLDSLERLRHRPIDRIYPGHFRPLDGGRAVIDGYIAHRRKREALILAALEEPATTDDVVARAYLDTPVHLHPVARYSAIAHLEMLEAQGRVTKRGDKWVRSGVY